MERYHFTKAGRLAFGVLKQLMPPSIRLDGHFLFYRKMRQSKPFRENAKHSLNAPLPGDAVSIGKCGSVKH